MQLVRRIFAPPSVDRRSSSSTEPYRSGGSTATSRDAVVISLDCSNDLHACGPWGLKIRSACVYAHFVEPFTVLLIYSEWTRCNPFTAVAMIAHLDHAGPANHFLVVVDSMGRATFMRCLLSVLD